MLGRRPDSFEKPKLAKKPVMNFPWRAPIVRISSPAQPVGPTRPAPSPLLSARMPTSASPAIGASALPLTIPELERRISRRLAHLEALLSRLSCRAPSISAARELTAAADAAACSAAAFSAAAWSAAAFFAAAFSAAACSAAAFSAAAFSAAAAFRRAFSSASSALRASASASCCAASASSALSTLIAAACSPPLARSNAVRPLSSLSASHGAPTMLPAARRAATTSSIESPSTVRIARMIARFLHVAARRVTASACPCSAACMRAVRPLASASSMEAPASKRSLSTSTRPLSAPSISAVRRRWSVASTSAPAWSSVRTTPSRPYMAALISAVTPS